MAVAAVTVTEVITGGPPRVDVAHPAGTLFELSLPALQAGGTAMAAVDIASARAHVRPSIDSDVILYSFASDNDPVDLEITDDDGDGVLVLTASPDATTEWQTLWPGRNGQAIVWWDLEIVDTEDVAHQITMPGTITLYHQVTR
jgi:hypothetical protein